ncbi:hypothetical protein Q7689_11335 [Nocardiopsis tropica]|uniref:hypothetical protein n=1 Tax=Nocardiopsis tropica TaxID=109330 RepID=UPI002E8AFDAC|nr:hypothetical protein [Nocardiopsis tropica]
MSFQFSKPSVPAMGGFFKPAEHAGHLILITQVYAIEDRFDQFKQREVPAATVDLVDLDEVPGEGLREGVLVTHTGIVNRLHAGQSLVLGRIGKAITKSGFEAWVLEEYREDSDDAVRAQAWMEAREKGITRPVPQTAPAAPVPAPAQQEATAAPASPAPAAPAMADPSDPAVQALLASLRQK